MTELEELRMRFASLYDPGSPLDHHAVETFDAVDILAKIDIANYTPAASEVHPQTEIGMAAVTPSLSPPETASPPLLKHEASRP